MADSKFVTIYRGMSPDIDLLKSMLDAEGITSFKRDETMGTLAPFFTTTESGKPIKLVVASEDEDDARKVVHKFES